MMVHLFRNQDYHLMRLDDGTEEFYNQSLDPFENTNLINLMSAQDVVNYNALCDTLHNLIGSQSCLLSSIEYLNRQERILGFPNPFSSHIYVDSAFENNHFELFNQQGRVVYYGSEISQQDFSKLPDGIYFLLKYYLPSTVH
jgi:hypothetical protein